MTLTMLEMMIPIEVTPVGIVIDVNDVHFSKEPAPNDRVRVRGNHVVELMFM